MSDSFQTHGLYSPWNFPGQNTGVGRLALLQGIFPTQRSNPRSPTLQSDFLPAEPQEKPKNTGVHSLSLLQQTFLTQKSNRGLLHCWWILYQLRRKSQKNVFCVYVDLSFNNSVFFQKSMYSYMT